MSCGTPRDVFSALHSPIQKPWHLVISPDPNTLIADKYTLKLDSKFNYQQYEELIEEVAFAVNKTNSKRPAFTNPVKLGTVEETDWLVVKDNTDGLLLQQTLLTLLETFPQYDLSSEKATEATIHDIEVRLGNVGVFGEPAGEGQNSDPSIKEEKAYRVLLGCGVVVCILAVVYRFGMIRMPPLRAV
ncbi:hypothetical protein FA13DRAFT_1786446 [Coprinellus micaceus]|uniref:Uncharacterized protein n=1 Tax=Coprinellus micaceus TaxID=71717 RepID=A0A4Y7TUJ3_COPMI|nr:hypothetical protein FA13DRAFT_1786446 [Coprinellus micaceus]